jgi:CBS domain containing-hemolysin-like protein
MIPANDFFMVEEKQIIGAPMVEEISLKDYSYVLVYSGQRSNIIGIIKVKEFAIRYLSTESDEMVAGDVMKENANLLTVYEDTNLLEMLMLFQAKSTRIALVCNQRRKIDTNILSIMYSVSSKICRNRI